jgi:hypothetical protein
MKGPNDIPPVKAPGRDIHVILGGLSLSLFLYHILTGAFSAYGYFIDEFYYIACSKHLALGYVDHPPLSIFLLALSRGLFGDSIPMLRLLPALAGAGTVYMTGLTASRLGGSRPAVVMAALGAIAMPVYMLMCSFYSMNAFEPLVWTSIVYCTLRLVQEEDGRYWIVIGVLTGIGLEIKHTMALYAAALFAGILLTGSRRFLVNRYLAAGVLCCVLLLLPNLIWQYLNGFPSLEFYRNAIVNKNVPRSPAGVIIDQVLFANPFALPLWGAGLVYVFAAREGRRYIFLGWGYLILLGVIIAGGSSRPDRIAAIYSVLFAAGAVAIEKIGPPRSRRLVRVPLIILLVAGTLVVAPVVTPLLPPLKLKSYLAALGLSFNLERGKMNEAIPQWLADRLGWRELATDVARVCESLPPGERQQTAILSTNYGEAGALELYGAEFGLPRVYATHNSYFTWGPPPDSVRTFVLVYVDIRDAAQRFESVTEAAIHTCTECTRPQQRIPIYIARGARFSMSKEWKNFKIYD